MCRRGESYAATGRPPLHARCNLHRVELDTHGLVSEVAPGCGAVGKAGLELFSSRPALQILTQVKIDSFCTAGRAWRGE